MNTSSETPRTPKKASKRVKRETVKQDKLSELRAGVAAIEAKSSSSSSTPLSPQGFARPPMLRPLKNRSPFCKFGLIGDLSSEPFRVAVDVAIALHRFIGSRKPVVIVDGDNVAHFYAEAFAKKKIEVLHTSSRSLADLGELLARAADTADVVVVGNVTAYYDDLVDSYKRLHQVESLTVNDWPTIKGVWRDQFSTRFRRLPAHAIFTGRTTDRYGTVFNADGAPESMAIGTKLRAERETAYDADLLIEMAMVDVDGDLVRRSRVLHDESGTHRVGETILVGGGYESFLEVAAKTRLNAAAAEPMEESSTADLFSDTREDHRRRLALLEEIKVELGRVASNNSENGKKLRAAALFQAFGVAAWASLESKPVAALERGREQLEQLVRDGGPVVLPASTPLPPETIFKSIRDGLDDAVVAATTVARNRALILARTLLRQIDDRGVADDAATFIAKVEQRWTGSGGARGSGGGRPRQPE